MYQDGLSLWITYGSEADVSYLRELTMISARKFILNFRSVLLSEYILSIAPPEAGRIDPPLILRIYYIIQLYNCQTV